MTAFSEYFAQAKRPGWKLHYLDYTALKCLLERFAERRHGIHEASCPNDLERFFPAYIDAQDNDALEFKLMENETNGKLIKKGKNIIDIVSTFEREEFCYFLDLEVRKCAKFYHEQVDVFNKNLNSLIEDVVKCSSLRYNSDVTNDPNGMMLNTVTIKCQDLGGELLEVYAFVGTNVTALRQILIRYDGMMRTLDAPPLGQWYIVTRLQGAVDHHFGSLLIHHGLLDMAEKFIATIRKLQASAKLDDSIDYIDWYIRDLSKDMTTMESVLMKAEKAVDKASRGRMALTDSFLYTIRYYFLAGSLMNDLVLQPGYIRTRGEKLKDEIIYFVNWRTGKKPTFDGRDEMNNTDSLDDKYAIQNIVKGPMVINLTSQFFFMMSHYIIEPSSAKYIDALGGNDALAGLLIGMTPWAALIAGFVYSFWSNHSFRRPLICSGIFLILGSIIYALAAKFHSIPIALAGRFMTGLGSPCTVNRRFIADTVPSSHRTAMSALFVTASAFGMSMGPGTAVLLDFLDFDINLPIIGKIQVNGMTGPGFFMFFLWVIYFVALVMYFKDGERIGLIELAAKQQSHYQPPDSANWCINDVSHSEKVHATCKNTIDFPVSNQDGNDNDSHLPMDEKESPRLINQASIICMIFIFLGKVTLEVLNSSDSIVTRHRYSWSVKNVGTLGFVNGMLVIPIATTVGFLSQHYPDRTLIQALLCVAFAGVLLLLDLSDFNVDLNNHDGYNVDSFLAVGPRRFIAGQIISFSSIHAFESVVQSTLSKVVPLALAQGTFNSGFIVTTLATLGRGLGDIFITMMGLISIRILLNLLVIPSLIYITVCLLLSQVYHHKLSV